MFRRIAGSLRFQLTIAGAAVSVVTGTAAIAAARYSAESHLDLDSTWLVVCAALFAGVASYVVAALAERPLRRLALATRKVGGEDFVTAETALPQGDEFAEISSALVALDRALVAKGNEVHAANRDLERRIHDRTVKLQAALDEAQQAERTRDNILSCISHEFRTPLASVRAFAEILLHHHDEPQNVRDEFLGIILAETDRLAELVTNILDYVKFLSGEVNWVLDTIEPAALANEAVARFDKLIVEHRLHLTIECANDVPTIVGDHDKLLRALANLVSNAIKFSRDGGTITVRVNRRGDGADFQVIDQGIGIPSSERERIFDRFHQTPDTLTDKPAGTGLGLPIAKEIALSHGGTIEVESAPGTGSTFHLVLPRNGNPELATYAPRAPSGERVRDRDTPAPPATVRIAVPRD